MMSLSAFFTMIKCQTAEFIFTKNFIAPRYTISVRSLRSDDLTTIYEWVNLPYAKSFWQMDGPKENLYDSFLEILENPYAHSFIGLMDNRLICQVDLYFACQDEVGQYYTCSDKDIGMHLLMGPAGINGIPHLSQRVMQTMIDCLFSYSFIENIIAEPDSVNVKACRLLERSGFTCMGNCKMSSKLASIYIMNKEKYHNSERPSSKSLYQ